MAEFGYKMVIVARKDLALSPGKLAAQVAHGAVEAALTAKAEKSKWFSLWRAEGQKKVVLKASSREELAELQRAAKGEGLTSHLVVDAGMTEIPPGTATVLAIGPGPDNIVDKVTGKLPMY